MKKQVVVSLNTANHAATEYSENGLESLPPLLLVPVRCSYPRG